MTKIFDLDTPTLLLDYQKLMKNINEIASFAKEHSLSYRPHIKTHKSVEIAKLQLQAGAIGITTATIPEAEAMAAGGINDILIAYPIASPQKIKRLIALLEQDVKLKISVDNPVQLTHLQNELEHTPFTLEVWIKVNSGLNRCGVEPGKDAVALAKNIMGCTKLKLGGILTHAGHSYAASSYAEIERIGNLEGKTVVESAEECEKAGIPIPVRSVGSTPTYKISGNVPGITEIRPGNAVFFDSIQAGLGVTSLENCALTVLASVVGVYSNRIVLDTGSKTLCLDKGAHGNETVRGFGHIIGHPEITVERLSEEHGVGTFTGEGSLKLNDKVQIIPNHACTVANQFEEYAVHEEGKVITTWKVERKK
ncbi:D-TA family PLP-dependent enzyme [Bacillus sp. SG-1]|uniref:D-TA family PLP-dependent enzyme n=1 Tax=Bacillus sp. SG-1 TaxID=161544 RepID=UPI0001543E30|nr:D-TA family PLP-dependent enzyme [Bacillus sp. SG-1]EDL65706.1 Serine racemase [Bacillus sp. SG-1]